jgi:hypothetical protein
MTTTPDDIARHSDMIETSLRDDTPEAHAALPPHVLWIIEHAPESDWADHPGLLHDAAPADHDRARSLWLAHVEANPGNPLALCEHFWEHRASALRSWRSEIEAGGTPELHRFAVLGSQP